MPTRDGPSDEVPSTRCPTCGAFNPAERTLCERCGMGLFTGVELADSGQPWWRGRRLRALLVTVLAAGGLIVGWSVLRDVGGVGGLGASGPGTDQGAAVSPTPTMTPSDEAASEPAVLGPGASGPEVRRWQQLLAAAGLDVQADGVYGDATARETRRFQRTIGEEPTGWPTMRTMAAAERASSLRLVTVYFVRDGELDGVRRRVERTQLARGALEALVAGPLMVELDAGHSTAIPPGTSLGSVRVDRGVVTVSLTGFAADPGPRSLRRRVDQVVRTLTRFQSIDEVRFRLPPEDTSVFAEAGIAVEGS